MTLVLLLQLITGLSLSLWLWMRFAAWTYQRNNDYAYKNLCQTINRSAIISWTLSIPLLWLLTN